MSNLDFVLGNEAVNKTIVHGLVLEFSPTPLGGRLVLSRPGSDVDFMDAIFVGVGLGEVLADDVPGTTGKRIREGGYEKFLFSWGDSR